MKEIRHKSPLQALLEHPYDPSSCFICGVELTHTNRTEEHVIPKWIQDRYSLWDQEIVLLNFTTLPYRQLKILCCKRCNAELSVLEKEIQEAVDSGAEAVRLLPSYHLFHWIAKIFLGILYKELFLNIDRQDPAVGSIATSDMIQEFAVLHFWLQTYSKHGQSEFMPGSVFIFDTQPQAISKAGFDLMDNLSCRTIAIRLGRVGIIADLLENGIHYRAMKDIYEEYMQHEYDPLQFRELATRIFYMAALLSVETVVEFTEKENGSIEVSLKWKAGEGQSLFGKWDDEEYSKMLSYYLNVPLDEVYKAPNKIMTLMPWEVARQRVTDSDE